MKHDHAYSKRFKDDISPEKAYDYFHTLPLDTDEFRCDKHCPVPVTLVNVRSTPEKWKVPPYFKYHSGYDDKHSSQCPNSLKIVKTSPTSSRSMAEQSDTPSNKIIISLSNQSPTSYEDVGMSIQNLSERKTIKSISVNDSSLSVKQRSTHISKLSSAVNLFHSNPNTVANFNGVIGLVKDFFHELRIGQYKLSIDQKIYYGKASIKLVTTRDKKELYLLQFEQKCQLGNAYFERPSTFLHKESLEGNSLLQRRLKNSYETGQLFHLYFWGSFVTTNQNRIRFVRQKPFYSDELLLSHLYVDNLQSK